MGSTRCCPVHNRIEAVMMHVERYWFDGVNRLAEDTGVAPSTISRLLRGKANPSFALAWKISRVLSKRLDSQIDPGELVSLDGSYQTVSVCRLCRCTGCCISNPVPSLDAEEPWIVQVRAGRWSLERALEYAEETWPE